MTDHRCIEYEIVLETSEIALIPLVKSLFDGAGIPYNTDGEAMMNLFPSELLATVMSSPAGLVRFAVPKEHSEAARALLESAQD